ncbi:MAG: hypothetical protein OEY95_06900 [Candidatus Bathyarchaeota archaeon]|nr:hypothetical protein [Candidatus Bathyarchaeota archaeon]
MIRLSRVESEMAREKAEAEEPSSFCPLLRARREHASNTFSVGLTI